MWLVMASGKLYANVGQPGIWKAGGGISLIVDADSVVSQSIRMAVERVDLFVYTGFAIVRGRYELINEKSHDLHFTMGFPINTYWRGEDINDPFGYSFCVDSLASFVVKRDGRKLTEVIRPFLPGQKGEPIKDWITWDIQFEPGQKSILEVTYITPTHHAYVTDLRGRSDVNGLVYIFESGAIWRNNIGRAELIIHFEDGLTTLDVEAVQPCEDMSYDAENNVLSMTKSNWEPSPGENFYLLYKRSKNKIYSFAEGVEDHQKLYARLDQQVRDYQLARDAPPFNCMDLSQVKTRYAFTGILLLGIAVAVAIAAFLTHLFFKKYKSHHS
jgi:hypothetical protein